MHLSQMLDETGKAKANCHARTAKMASSDWCLQLAYRRSDLHDLREEELAGFLSVSRILDEQCDLRQTHCLRLG